MAGFFDFDDDNDCKRTLGIRDKQILYRKANKRCQNPGCGKEIDFDEMQTGHKNAWSRGGRTSLNNSVCLCYRCNKLQGTDSWAVFIRKQGVHGIKSTLINRLGSLSLSQLRQLAKKHNIKVRGTVKETFFDSTRSPPTKKQYLNKLSRVVSDNEINSLAKEAPKKKKKKKSDDSWF